jgi:hypothetical protein
MAAIWGGLVIAPAMAAGFGAICYLLVKYIVLKREDSTRWGLITGPFWFFLVACVLTMSISEFIRVKSVVMTDLVASSLQGLAPAQSRGHVTGEDRCGNPSDGSCRLHPLYRLLGPLCSGQGHQEGLQYVTPPRHRSETKNA